MDLFFNLYRFCESHWDLSMHTNQHYRCDVTSWINIQNRCYPVWQSDIIRNDRLHPSDFDQIHSIIIPFYHDIDILNKNKIGYNGNPNTYIPNISERKYLFASSFSFGSVGTSAMHRGEIVNVINECMANNGSMIDGIYKARFDCFN